MDCERSESSNQIGVLLFAKEAAGVGGGFAFVFVFAVSEDVDSLFEPGVEAFFPGG